MAPPEFAPLLVWQRWGEDRRYRGGLQRGRLLNQTIHEVINLSVKLAHQVILQVLINKGKKPTILLVRCPQAVKHPLGHLQEVWEKKNQKFWKGYIIEKEIVK